MKNRIRKMVYLALALVLIGAIAFGFKPQPVAVDVASVTIGPMMVTVDDDGKTRIREKYIVSAPLAGRLQRIELDPGDPVVAGDTLLTSIEPSDPELLDARSLAQAEARVKAAKAALARAETVLEKARTSLDFAETELGRKRELATSNAISQELLDEAELKFKLASEEYRSAKFTQEIAAYEVEQAEAALLRTRPQQGDSDLPWQFEIRSPISGNVLRLFQESSAVVAAGTPLIEIGDPHDLEIELDVLSSDAVKVRPGDRVIVEHWGGPKDLEGRVRIVEPAAFTKISALGVEEQRVFVIIDIVDPPSERPTLGDGYRVEGRIVIWEADAVLQVPTSALFRDKDRDWAVFLVDAGHARIAKVKIGHSNGLQAEVLSGLREGDEVIVHPSDQVEDGVAIEWR